MIAPQGSIQTSLPDQLAAQLQSIPHELKTYRSWVLWRYEERPGGGELTKVLYSPHTGTRARTNDMRTWGSFQDCIEAHAEGGYSGLGFVFSSGDSYTGVDLDNCRNPETEAIEPWAEQIIAVLDGYAEISPSGRGVHVIVRGELPEWTLHRREKDGRKVEAYSQRRFFTVSGRPIR